LHACSEKVTIADLGHPASAGKVRFVNASGTFGVGFNIDTEDDVHGVAPVSTFLVGIQKTKISCKMGFIIGVHPIGQGWSIVPQRLVHGASSPKATQKTGQYFIGSQSDRFMTVISAIAE